MGPGPGVFNAEQLISPVVEHAKHQEKRELLILVTEAKARKKEPNPRREGWR